MSSISFPTGAGGRPRSPSSSVHQEEFFGSSYNASTSFQMNPLSQHPPRTPRTSVTSTTHSYVYGSEIYNPTNETTEKREVDVEEEVEDEEIEEIPADVKARVTSADTWREILKTSTGRDKAFKIIQYSLRVYLVFHTTVTSSALLRKPTRPPWEVELIKRVDSTASGLSLTRKCLILFNWLTPLTTILAAQPIQFSHGFSAKQKEPSKPLINTFLHAPPPVLLDLVNGLSDDIYAWSRLGLLGKRTGERAGKFSDWCWFAGTLVALVELNFERTITKSKMLAVESKLYSESMTGATAKSTGPMTKAVEQELQKLQTQDYWSRVKRTKLIMDLIFVSYDVFRLKPVKAVAQTFSGLTSAVLSSAILYQRHRNTLFKQALEELKQQQQL